MRAPAAVLSCLATAAATGCGDDPAESPTATATTPEKALGWVDHDIPVQGVKFQRPSAWRLTPGDAPLLATISSGLVTISVWRYPRNEPLPKTSEELDVAKDALVAAAVTRDPTFEVRQAKGTRAAHSPAVVIVADETVAGQPRRVRSTHIFAASSEIVVDAFAPENQYERVEDPIFRTLVRSFQITAPGG